MESKKSADEGQALLGQSRQGGPRKRRRGVFRPLDFFIVVALPWMVFVLCLAMFAIAYHNLSLVCWCTAGTCLAVALLILFVGARQDRQVQLVLGMGCTVAVVLGVLIGSWVYRSFLKEFYSIESGASYHNVSPAEPGAAHADATTIEFQEGTRVNIASSAGFHREGIVYCAAPIQAGLIEIKPPQYWAIGHDCCEARGGFVCGDVSDSTARQGVVLRLDNDVQKQQNYMQAARIASEANALGPVDASNPPTFVRWVANYEDLTGHLWWKALTIVEVSAVIFLIICLCAGTCVARIVKPSKPAPQGQAGATS
mmetsp:Transcript_57689/g.137238  ORF Transcript_57689/g.137238 Transcript_57689/m.137238 type:complete len:312 (+) Transcript_57689:103-1038(+)